MKKLLKNTNYFVFNRPGIALNGGLQSDGQTLSQLIKFPPLFLIIQPNDVSFSHGTYMSTTNKSIQFKKFSCVVWPKYFKSDKIYFVLVNVSLEVLYDKKKLENLKDFLFQTPSNPILESQ